VRDFVAAGRADAEPAGARTETAAAASSLAAATALTAARAATLTAACPATWTLTPGKTWHMSISFPELAILLIPLLGVSLVKGSIIRAKVDILAAIVLLLRPDQRLLYLLIS
jgi:hypothetical protein